MLNLSYKNERFYMDKISAEQDKKYTKLFRVTLFMLLIFGAVLSAVFTNYKEEVLVCKKSTDICFVKRTNLINKKSTKKLVKYSDISDVSYFKERIKGNRFAKGYSKYLITFIKKDNNPVVIFSGAYYEKTKLNSDIEKLSEQIYNDVDTVFLIKTDE